MNPGDKTAFVAPNGHGKSTLLKIITGQEESDAGEVTLNPKTTISYLSQNPNFNQNHTPLEAIFSQKNPITTAIANYEKALENHEDQETLGEAIHEMDRLNAWEYEARISKILSILQITNLTKPLAQFSGGQQKRIALAQVLISNPDLLILDEPTNHLDLHMIEWLEKYLTQQQKTLLMVTHDRYFLERICNQIIELDRGKIYLHKGNYSYYLEQKEIREKNLHQEISRAKNLYRRELDWIRTQPKARESKSRSRIDAFHDLKKVATQKITEQKANLQIKHSRLGHKVMELTSIHKAFPEMQVVHNFSYRFKKGERIGIIGNNGVGKSTFLNILTGKIPIDSGTIKIGETVKIGYYNQHGIKFKEGSKVIDAVRKIAEYIEIDKGRKLSASQMLERFLFPPKVQHSLISKLSGGEKKRLYLLTVLMTNPNFLILDEPTNDLDIDTLNTLEDFLQDFPGCLIIVSHDRFFLDKLVDHLFILPGNGKIDHFTGSYSQYRELEELKKAAEKSATTKPKNSTPNKSTNQKPASKRKLTFNEKREFEQLEKEIPELELQKAHLTTQMSQPKLLHAEINKIATELGKVTEKLEEKTLRWLELAEYE